MYESRISTYNQGQPNKTLNFGDISTISNNIPINTSTAPGFTHILCPTHPNYPITNICRSESCIEPLCPECIPKHIRLHQETKKPAKIQTLVNARKLAEQKFYVEGDLEKIQAQKDRNNPERLRQDMEKTVSASKNRLLKIIDRAYQKMFQNIQVIYSAHILQREKNQTQIRRTAAPLLDYLHQISTYKAELESQEFISALIEMLSEFPKKPEVKLNIKSKDFGNVEINDRALSEVERQIDNYVRVNVKCEERRINNLMNSSSNNTKFSRIERAGSMERSASSRGDSNSKRIFGNRGDSSNRPGRSASKELLTSLPHQMATSQVQTLQQNPVAQEAQAQYICVFDAVVDKNIKINTNNSLQTQNPLIFYFEQGTRSAYFASLNELENGFQKIDLDISFNIPEQHRSIVTPSGQVHLLGGRNELGVSNRDYVLRGKALTELPTKMPTERASFGVCANNDFIYVLGGVNSSNALTNKFERFDLRKRCWSVLRPCSQPLSQCELVSFNDSVVRVGGKSTKTSSVAQHRLDVQIYNPLLDSWACIAIGACVPPQVKMPVWGSGLAQTSHNQILIFGGYFDEYSKANETYKLEISGGQCKLQRAPDIYTNCVFVNPSYVHNRCLVAMQATSKGTTRNLMRFNGAGWRFVSC